MEEQKKWWESKAVVGGLVTVLASVGGGFGIIVDLDTQVQITELVVLAATAIGGLLSIYGRIKATLVIRK